MVSNSDSAKAAIATLCMDIFLLYVICTSPTLLWFDTVFVVVILCSHVLFYYALFSGNDFLIQFLHYCIFLSLAVSIFLENTKLLVICLGLLLTIQILWIVEDRCILNDKTEETKFGYGKELSVGVLLYTIIIAMKIGFKSKDIFSNKR
jgi:hypothetical protein